MSYTYEVTYEGYSRGLQFGGTAQITLQESLPPSLGLGKIRKYLIKHGIKINGRAPGTVYLTSWEKGRINGK